MDRRLQYTIALLFLFTHITVASSENSTTILEKLLPECSYKLTVSGEFRAVNVSVIPPVIHVGNYESFIASLPGQKVTRDVIIYWENYLKCNEEVQFHYKAFYMIKTDSGKFVKVYSHLIYANQAIFTELRYDIAYSFEVVSTDKHGASDGSLIYVPSDTDKTKPTKPLWLNKMQISRDVFMLMWENHHYHQTFRFHRSHQFTLHWCEIEQNAFSECSGKMYAKSVPITESHYRIRVENPKKNYQFAISTEMVKGGSLKSSVSSGLQWDGCSLPPNKRPDVVIIRKLWASVVSSTFIGLRWKLDCNTLSDLFTEYQIYYCPVISNTNLKCKEKLELKLLGEFPQNNTLPLAIVPNLKPATVYKFYVEMLTPVDKNIGIKFRTAPKFQSTSHE